MAYNPRNNSKTKHEYFAGLAMQGLLANTDSKVTHWIQDGDLPELAVKYADALLEELNKPKGE